MFGLSIDNLRDIKNCFVQSPQINKALLYGSRAKGNYKSGSDIDITLIGKNLNLSNTIYPLQGKLDKLYLPYQFDISIFDKLDNPDFIEHILRVGKTLYQKPISFPKHWQVMPFEKCVNKVRLVNKIPKKSFLTTGIYPVISQENEFINGYWNNESDVFKIKKSVVIFGDHTKKVKYIDFDFVLGADGVKVFEPKNDINPKFFFYKIKLIALFLDDLGYARHYRLLKKIEIPIPPLAEQQAIVKKLDALFSQIKQTKSQLEQNLQNAKDLWQSSLNQIFNNPDNDWQVMPFEKCVNKVRLVNKIPKKSFLTTGIYPVISQENEFINGYWNNESDVFKIKKSVVIFGDHTKKVKYIDFDFVLGADGVKVFESKNDINPKFFFYKIKLIALFLDDLGYARHYRLLKKIEIPIPSLAEQQAIVKKLDAISQQTQQLTQNIQNQLKSLETLEKSLLEKAFSAGF